jgi:hypothetical protein
MPAPAGKFPTDRLPHNAEQDEWKDAAVSAGVVEERLRQQLGRIVEHCHTGEVSLYAFETALIPLVFTLGRLAVALFLCVRQEGHDTPASEVRGGTRYESRGRQARLLGTFFGKVRYWRTYLCAVGGGAGYCPLDSALELPVAGFSTNLVGLMTRMATKMSYAQVTLVLRCFLGWSPSTTTVEHAVLGVGRFTTKWFENAPAPDGDGEILIIQIDSKSPPTATEAELEKRRGPRGPQMVSDSPRHRGRTQRKARGSKPRPKKGDKTKNGRMTTVVVMYTLRPGRDKDGKPVLKGPINKFVYASFAPKRHAVAIAKREADKRGFARDSGKKIQVVTDGDNDLAHYVKLLFPDAIHTLDVFHATEYLWSAGRSLYREGSDALADWANDQRQRFYNGEIEGVIDDLREVLAKVPKTGPGNKGKRGRLEATINYFAKRIHMMNYGELMEQDLEIGSGAIEGAVRQVVSQRFDCGGMRWIRERAEALLQLRCIEINEDWDDFVRFVHTTGAGPPDDPLTRLELRATEPTPLPTYGLDL